MKMSSRQTALGSEKTAFTMAVWKSVSPLYPSCAARKSSPAVPPRGAVTRPSHVPAPEAAARPGGFAGVVLDAHADIAAS